MVRGGSGPEGCVPAQRVPYPCPLSHFHVPRALSPSPQQLNFLLPWMREVPGAPWLILPGPKAAAENCLFPAGSEPQTEGFHVEMQGTEWALGAGGTSGALRPEREHGTRTVHGATAQLQGGVHLEPSLAVANYSMNINGQVLQDAAGAPAVAAGRSVGGEGKGGTPGLPGALCLLSKRLECRRSGWARRAVFARRAHVSSVPSQQRRTPTEQLRSGHASGTPRSPRNVARPHPETAKFPARRASEMPRPG